MPAKPQTIAEYLAPLSKEQRAALEMLRKTIRASARKAEECISYNIPAFRLHGKMLVAFGAAKNHCAFYPGAHPIRLCQSALKGYDLAKGTIRYQPNHPLPAALVRKLVRAGIAEKTEESK